MQKGENYFVLQYLVSPPKASAVHSAMQGGEEGDSTHAKVGSWIEHSLKGGFETLYETEESNKYFQHV